MATKKSTAAPKAPTPDLAQLLAELQAQLTGLTERLDRLEARVGAAPVPVAAAPAPQAEAKPPAPAPVKAAPPPIEAPGLSEEEILAVSAALAAYLGVRLRIRQIRLLSSPAWAQVGRVSIQASHRLHN